MEQRNESATTTNSGNGPHRRLHRLSPSLVIASIALFASLGGVGYAAATGSIDSREIKNNTIRGKDVRNGTLGGGDVKNGALGGSDVGTNSLTTADIDESTLGTVPRANTAEQAGNAFRAGFASNAGTVGGSPVSALQRKVRWVQVEGDTGEIRGQSGDITVTRGGEGFYFVDFGASTANGMLSASGAELGADNAFVNAQRCGGPPLGTSCGDPNTANRVLVHTDDPDDAALNDADFYLALVQ